MRIPLAFLLSSCLAVCQTFTPTPAGDDLFNRQDWAGAAREFRRAAEAHPDDGRAWFRLGSSLHRMQSYPEAAQAFRRAAEHNFQAPLAMAGAARAYAAGNDAAQALDWLGKAAQAGFAQPGFIDSDPALAALKSRSEYASIGERIRKNGKPCLTAPEYRQFDFWLGEWDVEVSGRNVGRSRIEKIDDGCIVQENWMPASGIDGKSWNYYNSATGKWEQLWMSAGMVLKLEGGLDGKAMAYRGVTTPNGATVLHRLTFTPMEGGKIHQFWEQSPDGGKTWTAAFDGIYVPRPEQPISAEDRQQLLAHLKRSQQVFAEALRGLSPAQAHFKAGPDRWSILECAEHLAQAEQLLFADAMEGLKLPVGAKSQATTDQILQVWGTRTQKVKSSGDYDPIGRWPDLATIKQVFDERRAKTIEFVATTQADLRDRVCCGQLDIWQQILALSAHTLRHVQQMDEVKASPGYPR
ncbi:MAG TPA: DinB family protein [Bryobacteraceae bacterium]